jgi:hypothetical protein
LSTASRTACLLAALLFTGCGAIYSNTVVPYTTSYSETPIGSKRCEINTHQVKEPISGYSIYAEWTTGYILNEAKRAGISEIHYMDKRTLSILLGIYKRETLIIYGD